MHTLFSGRLNRWNFFLGGLLLFFFSVVVSFFSFLLSHGSVEGTSLPVSFYILTPISLFFSISLGIRRFHDFDFSGWWVVPYILIPLTTTVILIHGGIAALRTDSGFFTFLMKIELIFDIFLLFYPGTHAENNYGSIPTTKPLMWHAVFPKKVVEQRATIVQIKSEEPAVQSETSTVHIATQAAGQDDRGPGEPIAPPSL